VIARIVACLLLVAACGYAAAAAPCSVWPAWDNFRDKFVSDDGRVVDRSSPQSATTSEGQSYGLFFALAANDRAAFDRLLRWTENNLAGGDLTARLPAWQWGKRNDGTWGIIDANAASDADLWIAYALAEAGRLWKEPRYAALADLLAARIAREETDDLPGLGRTLLPGPQGFHTEPELWKLNPSYVPPQLMQRMAALYPKSPWPQMTIPAANLVASSAPRGFAPEWVLYKAKSGFQPDADSQGEGSFNAIRVYLWLGMLPADDPQRGALLKRFAPMAAYVLANGVPPAKADTQNGSAAEAGPAGFSAALAPFLAAAGQPEAAERQRLRLVAKGTLERDDNYYDQVLGLFGLGWMDGQFKFGRNGVLMPRWTCAAPPPQ
jgi:endoglucanase